VSAALAEMEDVLREREAAEIATVKTDAAKRREDRASEIEKIQKQLEQSERQGIAVTQRGAGSNSAIDARTAGVGALQQQSKIEIVDKTSAKLLTEVRDLNK